MDVINTYTEWWTKNPEEKQENRQEMGNTEDIQVR